MASYSYSYSPPSSPLMGRLPHQATQDSLKTKEGSDDSDDDDDDDGIVSINLLLDDTPSFSVQHRADMSRQTPTAIRAKSALFSTNHDNDNNANDNNDNSNINDSNDTPPRSLQINNNDCSMLPAPPPPSSTSSSSSSSSSSTASPPLSPVLSPATQTLNHLSQPTDLRYDMSQLEMDVAQGLAEAAARSRTNRVPASTATATATASSTSAHDTSNIMITTAKSSAPLFSTNKKNETVNTTSVLSATSSTGLWKQQQQQQQRFVVSGEHQPNQFVCYKDLDSDDAHSDGNDDDNDIDNDNDNDNDNDVTRGTAVCQVDPATNRVIATFDSIRQASLQTRVPRHHIDKALSKPPHGVPVDGYIWRRRGLQLRNNNHDKDDDGGNGGNDGDDDDNGDSTIAKETQHTKAARVTKQRDPKDRNRGTSNKKESDKPKITAAKTRSATSTTTTTTTVTSRAAGKRQLPQPLQQMDAKTGKVLATFSSIAKARERTNLPRDRLSKALNLPTGDPAAIVGGYLWRRVTDGATHNATNKSNTSTSNESSIVGTGCHDSEDHDDVTVTVNDNKDHDHKSKDRKATNETAKEAQSSSLSTSTPRMIGDYSIHYVIIEKLGPLGLAIIAYKPPSELYGTFECQEKADVKCCTVERIINPSIAGDAGVQQGDWFLDTDTSPEAIPGLETYTSVLAAAQQAQRPLTFCLARQSKAEPVNHPKKKTSQSTEDLQEQPSDDEASIDRKRTETAMASKREDTSLMPPPTAAATVTLSSAAVLSRQDDPSQESFGFQEFCINSETVPFCSLCNGRRTLRPVHHAWCPEHATFNVSGAAEILERIQQGAQMHCGACVQEFKDGRISKGTEHSKECQRNQKLLEAIHAADSPPPSPKKTSAKKRKPEELPKKMSRSSAKRQQTSKRSEALHPTTLRSRKISVSENFLESEANMSDTGSDDGSHSAYDGGNTLRRPIQILTVAKKADNKDSYKTASTHSQATTRKSSVSEQGRANNHKETGGKESTISRKATKSSSEIAPKRTAKKNRGASNAGTNNRSSEARKVSAQQTKGTSRRAAGGVALQPKRTIEPHCHSDYDVVEVDDQTDDAIDVAWESCGNPWGPEGHVDGDVILFTHTSGLGHHETLLPSARYEGDPFSSSKRYHKTHRTPEDGFQALILKRDPLVIRPWGFTCQRHEFGGACLVTSVDPLSPADAAVYLGAAFDAITNSELRVNDMIVSINGKHVGGMSEAGFEIEVEISGPELVLLVSRYKFASKVQDRIQEAERSYIDAIDKVINDERLLGWTDIGATTTTTITRLSEPEVLSANLESALASPIAAGKPKVSPQTISARRANGSCSDESVEQVKISRVEDDTNLIRNFVGHAPSHMKRKFGKADELSSGYQETKLNREANPQPDCQVPEETTRLSSSPKATPEAGTEEYSRSQGSMSFPKPISEGVVEEDCADSQGSMSFQNNLADDEAEECTHSQGSMSSHKTTLEPDEEGSDTINDAESEWEDDGNAWLGCVCGVIHNETVAVFWIQCDTCQSWYNVSEECAGLGANDAEKVERWICWGCPVSDGDNCSTMNTSVLPQSEEVADLPTAQDPSCDADDSSRVEETVQRLTGDGCIRPKSKPREKEDGTYAKPKGPGPVGFYWHKEFGIWSPKGPKHKPSPSKLQAQNRASSNEGGSLSKERSINRGDSRSEEATGENTQPSAAFTRGDIVFIEEHGWAGVSNASGAATVLKSRVDDEGDLLYDIKYIIGRTARGVLAEYVSLHSF